MFISFHINIRYYVFAVKAIRELQSTLYDAAKQGQHSIEAQIESSLLSGYIEKKDIVQRLTEFSNNQANFMSKAWADIFPVILTTYRDGYVIGDLDKPTVSITKMFYPKYWLDAVGYWDIGGNYLYFCFSIVFVENFLSLNNLMNDIFAYI